MLRDRSLAGAAREARLAESGARTTTITMMSAETVQASGASTTHTDEMNVLYLFAQAVQWCKGRDDDAAWELLFALNSSDLNTRIVAKNLLCDADL
jgi:hypothetical protein